MKQCKCKDIPPNLWPPENATEIELNVYRLTRNATTLLPNDFLSKYELDKIKGQIDKNLLNVDKYYALSVFEDIEDANKLLKKFPTVFKNISVGVTKYNDGCIRSTPTPTGVSHKSWWLYDGATPETYFEIVKENSDE